MNRFNVSTVIATEMTSQISFGDLTEFMAACARYRVPADAVVKVETRDSGLYFRLVVIMTVETASETTPDRLVAG